MQDMLQGINASQIPAKFLDSVYVTLATGKVYSIENKYLKDGVSYKNFEDHLRRVGIKGDITMVEIIVDLDKARTHLQQEANDILDSVFDE